MAAKKAAIVGIGRRKTAVARVFLVAGSGEIKVNARTLEDYFGRETSRMIVRQPLVALDQLKKYDFNVLVRGGGLSGQAEAVRLGMARALVKTDAENKPPLRKEGHLTRDARAVERKKYGRHKARKRPQYSKR
ncbi:MAG: 30S ribosomal protein S9 [Proteobacteria bacterium]|nr:MAG: 30S ribosomal protein S9 [Pseudomonadota bacterium]